MKLPAFFICSLNNFSLATLLVDGPHAQHVPRHHLDALDDGADGVAERAPRAVLVLHLRQVRLGVELDRLGRIGAGR